MPITALPINTTALSSLGAEIAAALDATVTAAGWRNSSDPKRVTALAYNGGTSILTLTFSDATTLTTTIAAGSSTTIINDLVTGGAGSALSAQQGVTLKSLIDAINAAMAANGGNVKADGSVAFTQAQTGVTPTAAAHLATKGYVDAQVTATVPWAPNDAVSIHELRRFTVGGVDVLMRSLSDRTTGANSTDGTEYLEWAYVSQQSTPAFSAVASAEVPEHFQISEVGRVWQRVAVAATGATFDATEQLAWSAMTSGIDRSTWRLLDIGAQANLIFAPSGSGTGGVLEYTGAGGTAQVLANTDWLQSTETSVVIVRNTGTGTLALTAESGLTGGLIGDASVDVGDTMIITFSQDGLTAYAKLLGGSAAEQSMHWARWQLTSNAASTTFVVAPGTNLMPLFFAGVSSGFGLVTDATNIVCAQSGRYRFDWLLMAPNTEFNDDGEVHIVVNGVSVGNVFYDMNQTAAVNQTTGTLTVDLDVNDLVQVRYAGSPTADAIVWGKGTYLYVSQVPSSTLTLPGSITAVDQAASGYFDIGTMRMQWGDASTGNMATSLPAPFANSSYAVTVLPNGTANVEHRLSSRSTGSFQVDFFTSGGGGVGAGTPFIWMAIGRKP